MDLMGHYQFAFATRHTCTCKGKKPTIVVDLNRGGWIKLKVQACCFKRHFRWPDKLYGLWTRSVHKQEHKYLKHNSLLELNNIHKYRYHIFWSWRLLRDMNMAAARDDAQCRNTVWLRQAGVWQRRLMAHGVTHLLLLQLLLVLLLLVATHDYSLQ